MGLTSAAVVTMLLQNWLLLILILSIAANLSSGSKYRTSVNKDKDDDYVIDSSEVPGDDYVVGDLGEDYVVEDPGEDYVVGGVPLVEPHQSRPGAAPPPPGGLDWDGFEWVASLRVYTEVKYYFARKTGMTRQGCEKNCPNLSKAKPESRCFNN